MKNLRNLAPATAMLLVFAVVGCRQLAPTGTLSPQQNVEAASDPNVRSGAVPVLAPGLQRRQVMAIAGPLPDGNAQNGQILFSTDLSQAVQSTRLTSNGRNCATCHLPDVGFGLTPDRAAKMLQDQNHPLLEGLMADAGPDAPSDPASLQQLRKEMLDKLQHHALIHVVVPNPNYDASFHNTGSVDYNPRFLHVWRSVPTTNNAAFANPMALNDPATNKATKTGVIMWDLREPSLAHQAQDASQGHAQVKGTIPANVPLDIAAFERETTRSAELRALGHDPGQAVADPKHTVDPNDPINGVPLFSTDVERMRKEFFSTVAFASDPHLKARQVHGMQVFMGTPQKPHCIVCHNRPEVLDGSTAVTDTAGVSERNKFNFPRQHLRLKELDANGHVVAWHNVDTVDPGVAGTTGLFSDLNTFKIPQLRGIAKQGRFFHDNTATDLHSVVEHYIQMFGANSARPIMSDVRSGSRSVSDLVEFLKVL